MKSPILKMNIIRDESLGREIMTSIFDMLKLRCQQHLSGNIKKVFGSRCLEFTIKVEETGDLNWETLGYG